MKDYQYFARSIIENMFSLTLTEFFESSTIHGVSYLSKRGYLVKIFWLLIISTGFIMAGNLIHESFKSWEESPVKTTIETLPISEMTWPNVTVCPPENTFTDLNDDLVKADGMMLSQDDRNNLIEHAIDLLLGVRFEEFMKNFSFIQEENQHYNWYKGFTQIDLPEYAESYSLDRRLDINVKTSATSGLVSTLNFGEKFNPSDVPCNFHLMVSINVPKIVKDSENTTLILEVKRIKMNEISEGYDRFYFDFNFHDNIEEEIFFKNFTPPGEARKYFTFERKVTEDDVNKMNLTLMPGFLLRWHYSEDVEPEELCPPINNFKTRIFRRY